MCEEADGQKTRRQPGQAGSPLQQPAVDPGGEEGAEAIASNECQMPR